MNEIVRIHIAGVAYEIDIAAKKQLDSYIAAVRRSLADAKDVLEDIELRITEILGERGVYKNDVIKLSDIDAVREQLGGPKDFSSSEPHSRPRSEEKIADKIRYEFADKKYFRDSENGIIGGVIAGLANYTGWDLTLLRVLFAMLAIFTAFFPFAILYIVVWISAPEARTTTERLAMEGKPINIENIKQSAKDFA